MTPEGHEFIVTQEGSHIREKNLLQIELARLMNGPDASDAAVEEWLVSHSKEMRGLIETELETNAEFFTDLADPVKHEEKVGRFLTALREQEGIEVAA